MAALDGFDSSSDDDDDEDEENQIPIDPPLTNGNANNNQNVSDDDHDNKQNNENSSLIIPITTSTQDPNLFIEIFPEEIKDTPVSTMMTVLKDESAKLDVWADAALLYMQQKHARDSLTLLEDACDHVLSSSSSISQAIDKNLRVRLLASTGIAQMAAAAAQQRGGARKAGGPGAGSSGDGTTGATGGSDPDLRQQADQKFTQAAKVDTFFPMTWIGRGMLNLANERLDQAKFFFQTTLKQCGPVMPALLGMAAVLYGEGDFQGAQDHYAQAIRKFPTTSGAPTRVGFGLASYRLGQVDRAKAAFARALQLDPECVEAMVGAAVLDMSSLDETARDFSKRTEKAIKMMSMANLLDHSNAMVQNHLANHYFWKWTPVTGHVQVQQGSNQIKTSQHLSLETGERIRIGTKFETSVVEESQEDDDTTVFMIQNPWKEHSATGLSVWKKDYDRVISLAKGAYSSTQNPEIQAESLFFLARVYHVREEIDNANKFYERAVKLAPSLTPARFGLAQTLVVKEDYTAAMDHLQQLISTNTTSATSTDALALLGLLQVRTGKKVEEGLGHLRKAIELDPLNPDFQLLEALALQQHKTTFPKALDRYKKAIFLMQRNGKKIPYEVYANSGVLCHETKNYDEAMDMYKQALAALDQVNGGLNRVATLKNEGMKGGRIQMDENGMFCDFVESRIEVVFEPPHKTPPSLSVKKSVSKKSDGSNKDNGVKNDENKGDDDKMDVDGNNEESEGRKVDGEGKEDSLNEKGDKMEDDNDKKGTETESDKKGMNAEDGEEKEEEKDDGDFHDGDRSDDDDDDDDDYHEKMSRPKRTFKIVEGTVTDFPFKEGDRIRFGENFVSDIVSFSVETMTIVVKDEYDPKSMDMVEDIDKPITLIAYVKRENMMLKIPEATTVAFNIARLHEATGRILPAIELHKAILKRNPAYVNSSLRLACIAVDCGCLKECSEWLKISLTTSPTNPEVRTLIGNLHLSLCDFASAQPIFDGLLAKKVPNVEAYAALSLGNIYFANLSVKDRYAKHLQYASDFYKSILQKDALNAYAANGLGTVLAEKGELFKAKEVFNRVRETSGDTIADALLNLGHIYLAQKKHPEALQMYQSYMKRAEDVSTPVSSKSRIDDVVDVLLYIAFAYFDWARHTELFNDTNAAPADGRYKQAMEHLELAISKNSKKEVVLKYNLCMTRLQAANCVLQKLTRNIPRTVEELEEALEWLRESLVVVEEIVKLKNDKSKKITIPGSTLQNFLIHCRANISSAESHLEDEKKRRAEADAEREIHRLASEAANKEASLREAIKKAEETKKQEFMDRKAEEKMMKVEQLRSNWENEQAAKEAEKAKKARKMKDGKAPGVEDFIVSDEDQEAGGGHGLFDDSDDDSDNGSEKGGDGEKSEKKKKKEEKKPSAGDLFGDSDDDDDSAKKGGGDRKEKMRKKLKAKMEAKRPSAGDLFGDSEDGDSDNDGGEKKSPGKKNSDEKSAAKPAVSTQDLFGDSDDDDDDEPKPSGQEKEKPKPAVGDAPDNKELFGDSEDESDEELVRVEKRDNDEKDGDQPNKKRRVLEDE